MALEIYDGATFLYALPRVMNASLTDKLSGERTLSFSTLISRSQGMRPGLVAKLDGQYYSVVRVSRKIADGFPITMADCEHISYLLNDEAYNLVTFVFEGPPLEGLQRLLGDTPFSIGICEATETVAVAFTEGTLNRRNALMRFIDLLFLERGEEALHPCVVEAMSDAAEALYHAAARQLCAKRRAGVLASAI